MPKTLWLFDAGRCLGCLCLASSLLALVALADAPGKDAEKRTEKPLILEKALAVHAPAIRDFLWHKMKHPEQSLHVGVVKFLVQFGNQPPSDNVGPLNWRIARRLEAALILSLDKSQEKSFRILHIHGSKKELRADANHLKEEHRAAFFDKEYDTAWGSRDEKHLADVFVTGLVSIADNARTLKVAVQAFDKTDKKLVEVCIFPVVAEPSLLAEAGVSFALARGSDEKAVASLLASRNRRESLPAETSTSVPITRKIGVKVKEGATVRQLLKRSPIDFKILYKYKDETKAQIIEEDGTVPEPDAKTEVTFRLRHKNTDNHTYGVVLRINGENTINPKERQPDDSRAYMWVVEPNADFEIKGYRYKSRKSEAAKFRVLPASESVEEEVNYGPHAGTFTLVIFRGRTDGKDQPDDQESEVVQAVHFGVLDDLAGKPNKLESLQGQLQQDAVKSKPENAQGRGVIVPGDLTKQEVQSVEFNPYPTPVSTINLRYYKPHDQE